MKREARATKNHRFGQRPSTEYPLIAYPSGQVEQASSTEVREISQQDLIAIINQTAVTALERCAARLSAAPGTRDFRITMQETIRIEERPFSGGDDDDEREE